MYHCQQQKMRKAKMDQEQEQIREQEQEDLQLEQQEHHQNSVISGILISLELGYLSTPSFTPSTTVVFTHYCL